MKSSIKHAYRKGEEILQFPSDLLTSPADDDSSGNDQTWRFPLN